MHTQCTALFTHACQQYRFISVLLAVSGSSPVFVHPRLSLVLCYSIALAGITIVRGFARTLESPFSSLPFTLLPPLPSSLLLQFFGAHFPSAH
jgi:predicted membrane chloride channel (bestrophin family)